MNDIPLISFEVAAQLDGYSFTLPVIRNLKKFEFKTQVAFFVGENGSGKSTLLRALALKCGFGHEGGSKHIQFKTADKYAYAGIERLADQLKLVLSLKPLSGYFFRAESFYTVASYIDEVGVQQSYGGALLHTRSHGERFSNLLNNRLSSEPFLIFDEPEVALSPQRQLAFMVKINEICKNRRAQIIIATHSPLLLAYPGATLYSFDDLSIAEISYQQTDHYQLTKRFLTSPEAYLKNLF